MSRLLAFTCLTCAAFAWVPPGIDRAGLAALGLAFIAWSVGRSFRLPFSFVPRPAGPVALEHPERIEPLSVNLMDQMVREAEAAIARGDSDY